VGVAVEHRDNRLDRLYFVTDTAAGGVDTGSVYVVMAYVAA